MSTSGLMGPLDTPKLDEDEIEAFKALKRGDATAHQQGLVLGALQKKLCRRWDCTHRGGDTHDTAFLNGRGYVADLVLRAINAKVDKHE